MFRRSLRRTVSSPKPSPISATGPPTVTYGISAGARAVAVAVVAPSAAQVGVGSSGWRDACDQALRSWCRVVDAGADHETIGRPAAGLSSGRQARARDRGRPDATRADSSLVGDHQRRVGAGDHTRQDDLELRSRAAGSWPGRTAARAARKRRTPAPTVSAPSVVKTNTLQA